MLEIKNKDNRWIYGGVFVSLWVAQQIISFTYLPFNLVSPYWLLIVLLLVIIGLPLLSKRKSRCDALIFAIVCAFFSVATIINGTSIGEVVIKVLYIVIGYLGLVFIQERIIKLAVFDILLILLYVLFYRVYFQYDVVTRMMLDEDLFGHASSNTIAMTLNTVTYLYLWISKVYKAKNKIRLIMFSSINLFLIVVQGSRAGMLVAILIFFITIFSSYKIRFKGRTFFLYLFFFGAIGYLFLENSLIVQDFLSLNKISADAYEEDVRSEALAAFFSKMDIIHFLTGYNYDYKFVGIIDRTFNAFFDFWKVYGVVPFTLMAILLIRRIIKHRNYEIPLLMLLPFFAYSLFESLWGGSFWDVLLFMVLFYSRKDEKVIKACNTDSI